jgi:hypothetical protein
MAAVMVEVMAAVMVEVMAAVMAVKAAFKVLSSIPPTKTPQ